MEKLDTITDVPGVLVGHSTNLDAKTGCTCLIFERGARCGVAFSGGAQSTRQIDSLNPLHSGSGINAILITGGSAYGLDAAGGVMRYLEENGMGIPYSIVKMPVVPTAVIFDLFFGDSKIRPDMAMGYNAAKAASSKTVEIGSIGAGCGATVGKVFTVKCATKGGLGSASKKIDNITIGAIAVVNSFGDVYDKDMRIIAGARKSEDSMEFVNTEQFISENGLYLPYKYENTTIIVLLTDGAFDKTTLTRMSWIAIQSMVRRIRPVHTPYDGDIAFFVSAGDKDADPIKAALNSIDVAERAIIRAIKYADGFGIIPSYREMNKLAEI